MAGEHHLQHHHRQNGPDGVDEHPFSFQEGADCRIDPYPLQDGVDHRRPCYHHQGSKQKSQPPGKLPQIVSCCRSPHQGQQGSQQNQIAQAIGYLIETLQPQVQSPLKQDQSHRQRHQRFQPGSHDLGMNPAQTIWPQQQAKQQQEYNAGHFDKIGQHLSSDPSHQG